MTYEIPANVLVLMQSRIGAPWSRDRRNCRHLAGEVIAALGHELPPVLDARWQEVERPDTWALAVMHRPFQRLREIRPGGAIQHPRGRPLARLENRTRRDGSSFA
jgi:hypothetical protein